MQLRIGQGYDVHQLKQGRPFYLGGILLDSDFGPDGHSDADVLLHAVCDALLGALALGDIGVHFPNTDERWRGVRSTELLAACYALVKERGYVVNNLDCSLCLEAPKVLKYRTQMAASISQALQIEADCVSIKATTSEQMGYVGRGEGVWALAIVLLTKPS